MNSSLSSNICDQNVNFFTKISCRSEMKATRSPGETAKYVIKAKLVSSLRDTILANFGLFRRQKNGFWFVYNKFLLPFHNKHILSCKKMQKKFSLHIHFKFHVNYFFANSRAGARCHVRHAHFYVIGQVSQFNELFNSI